MPSPFPGVDPYIEASHHWPDFHDSVLIYAREQIQPELRRRGYRAAVAERAIVVDDSERTIVPDLAIARQDFPKAGPAVVDAEVPFEIEVLSYEERQVFLEVHSNDGVLVTVIELLSPANKRSGRGRDLYLQKQEELLRSSVNLVEIDLLREGKHTLAAPEHVVCDNARLGPWYSLVCVHRAEFSQRYFVYPIRLESPLPRIRIPLQPGEPEVVLALQAACDRAYDAAGFRDLLDYSRPPAVSLSADDLIALDAVQRKSTPVADS